MTDNERFIAIDDGLDFMVRDTVTGDDLLDAEGVADVLNDYEKETEQLRNGIKLLQEENEDLNKFFLHNCKTSDYLKWKKNGGDVE